MMKSLWCMHKYVLTSASEEAVTTCSGNSFNIDRGSTTRLQKISLATSRLKASIGTYAPVGVDLGIIGDVSFLRFDNNTDTNVEEDRRDSHIRQHVK